MINVFTILLIGIISGTVTSLLSLRADRFFIILLLISLAGLAAKLAIQTFLFVGLFGAALFTLQNKDNFAELINKNRRKIFSIIILVAIFSLIGSYLFSLLSDNFLKTILGIVAIFYGIRILFIKVKENKSEKNAYDDYFCSIYGPIISSFSVGLIGTSLKSLKLPYAINVKNIRKESAYLSSIFVFLISLMFAITYHSIFSGIELNTILPLAALLFVTTFFTYEIVTLMANDKLRQYSHVIIGIILLLVGFRLILITWGVLNG